MTQKIALVFGVVFIILGGLGFVPGVAAGGLLLGMFSLDVMHSVVYLISGVVAIVAGWHSDAYARLYFKVFGIVYAIFTVAGLLQGDTILGLMATNIGDNLLDLVAAAIALWLGFGAAEEHSPRRAQAR